MRVRCYQIDFVRNSRHMDFISIGETGCELAGVLFGGEVDEPMERCVDNYPS